MDPIDVVVYTFIVAILIPVTGLVWVIFIQVLRGKSKLTEKEPNADP